MLFPLSQILSCLSGHETTEIWAPLFLSTIVSPEEGEEKEGILFPSHHCFSFTHSGPQTAFPVSFSANYKAFPTFCLLLSPAKDARAGQP